MNITHEDYFLKYDLSVEQYGEILVRVAYGGQKIRDNQKGYDVNNATIDGKPARIEVKSKLAEAEGPANVVHCSDTKFKSDGMTHLVVILIERRIPSVTEAWLLTREQAQMLRRYDTKSKYISVNDLRNGGAKGRGELRSVEKRLQDAARSYA
jgi:hypothetical protein